jgi:hypothetical protein
MSRQREQLLKKMLGAVHTLLEHGNALPCSLGERD